MTYQEIKDRLSKCELTLSKLKDSNTIGSTKDIKNKVQQLTLLKESLQIQLAEADKGVVYTDDEDTAKDLADDGANVKLTNEEEGVKFSIDETKAIAKSVGKAVAIAVKNLGDEIGHMKATNIEENSFDINIEYRNDNEDSFSFYIKEDSLHLQDFSFDKELTDVGVKPSGEAQVNVDHLANELTKHFKSMNEKVDSKDKPELKKLSKALSNSVKAHLDQKKSLDKAINTEGEVSEAPEGMYYIKISKDAASQNKAQVIFNDLYDIKYELNDDPDGVIMYFKKEDFDAGIMDDLEGDGVQILDTNIPDVNEDAEEDAKNDADYAQGWHDDPRQDEDTDVGHVDDEPDMLQATAYEIATYAAKLSKKLAKYDAHDGEVDFPNWWQAKLILAKDYMSKAYHYLDSEEKQPALDQLALESFIKEGRGDGEAINNIIINMANEDDISTREAAEEIIDHITHIFINTKGKEVEENVDKVAGGIPYRRHGNKVIISEPLDDATKERLIGKAKEHGYFAQPNTAGGITITLKDGMYEGEETLQEKLSGDQREALMDLQNILDQAAQLGDEAKSIIQDTFPEELRGAEAYDVFNFGSSTNSYDNTLESLISDIERRFSEDEGDDDLDEKKNIVFSDSAYDTVVHTMRRLAKKYKAGDKSVVKHLKKLTHIKKQLEKAKIAKAAMIGRDQELETDTELREAGPGFKHDCAAKVIHKEHGAGNTIPEKHTLVKEGNKYVVTHYDVLFENGNTVLDIPVNELDIKTTNEHWHKGYKKKKK